MADLAKLILPRVLPKADRVVSPNTGLGEPPLDPVADAVNQMAAIQAYFAVVAAGGNPTASQFAAAQTALGALGADLRLMQSQPAPPPGSQVWVSGPAAVGVAGVSALVGGVVGWFARGQEMIPIERLQRTQTRTIEADVRDQRHEQRIERERAAGLGALPPAAGLGSILAGGLAGIFGIRRPR